MVPCPMVASYPSVKEVKCDAGDVWSRQRVVYLQRRVLKDLDKVIAPALKMADSLATAKAVARGCVDAIQVKAVDDPLI